MYNWSVPNIFSDEVLIRVVDASNSCKQDKSDNFFSFVSEVDVTYPDCGESIQATVGEPYDDGQYIMNNVPIVTDGGYLYDSGGPDGYYSNYEDYTKTIYPETPGNKIRLKSYEQSLCGNDYIRIYDGLSNNYIEYWDYYGGTQFDVTSTHETGALTIRFYSDSSCEYSGFESYINSVGQPTEQISWDITGTSLYFDIEYSYNNGVDWIPIVNDYYSTSGDYNWYVPNTPSENCLVRVIDNNNNQIVNESECVFEIIEAPSYIVLTNPDGGENWEAGYEKDIKWFGFGLSDLVSLEYYCADWDEEDWVLITETNSDNGWDNYFAFSTYGMYEWEVPNTPGLDCYIRVTDLETNTILDESNSFQISSVFGCTNSTMYNYNPNATNDDGSCIPQPPAISLIDPNGGEILNGCSSYWIDWDINNNAYEGAPSGEYAVYLSKNNGDEGTWELIASGITNTQHWWDEVPNENHTTCRIKVVDWNDPDNKYSISDDPFEMQQTEDITLIDPNGGEQWIANNPNNNYSYQIIYENESATNVHIYYSTNGGDG